MIDRRKFLCAAPAGLIVASVVGPAQEGAADCRGAIASGDPPAPVAPPSTNSAVRKHRFTKFDLEMIEDLGF